MCDSGCRLNEKGYNNHNQAFGSGCRLNEKGENNHNQALRGSWRGPYGEAGTPPLPRNQAVLRFTADLKVTFSVTHLVACLCPVTSNPD